MTSFLPPGINGLKVVTGEIKSVSTIKRFNKKRKQMNEMKKLIQNKINKKTTTKNKKKPWTNAGV